nr:membrane protein insertion efficiency factor YidD [Loigolactobacillus rennini]
MRFVIQQMIKLYQRFSRHLPQHCRYYPTCSHYTQIAVQRFGVFGLLMGLSRILRCQPFARGGFDPVPQHFSLRRNQDKIAIMKVSEKYYGQTAQQNQIKH